MSLSNLLTMLIIVFLSYALADFYINFIRVRAVKGSFQRYRLTTLSITMKAGAIVFELLICATAVATQSYVLGAMYLVVVPLEVMTLLRLIHGDDNWFNDQWKRAKRGIKKIRQRIQQATPSPLPSPA
jgi:hypothetical protein